MNQSNRLTRALRWLTRIWWWGGIVAASLMLIFVAGKELGHFEGSSLDVSFPVEWTVELEDPPENLSLRLLDPQGEEVAIPKFEASGYVKIEHGSGFGAVRPAFYFSIAGLLGLGFFGLHQLRKLFDELAEGRYFVEANALRIRRIAFCFLGFVAVSLILQAYFDVAVTLQTGKDISGGGGWTLSPSPTFFAGLFLLVLAEVFREGAKMKAEQDLTI